MPILVPLEIPNIKKGIVKLSLLVAIVKVMLLRVMGQAAL